MIIENWYIEKLVWALLVAVVASEDVECSLSDAEHQLSGRLIQDTGVHLLCRCLKSPSVLIAAILTLFSRLKD